MATIFRLEEARLLAHLRQRSELASRGVTASCGESFCVAIFLRGAPVCVWGYNGESLVFRHLSSWEPSATAVTVEDVLLKSLDFSDMA